MINEINSDVIVKASGILFYRKLNNNIQVLLGLSKTYKPEINADRYTKWTILGGHCEKTDSSYEDTALREFYEETCGIFEDMTKKYDMLYIMKQSLSIYISNSCYMLYIIDADKWKLSNYLDNPEYKFQIALSIDNSEELPEYMKEMSEISWLPYTTLFNKTKTSHFIRQGISRNYEIINFFNNLYIDSVISFYIEKNNDKEGLGKCEQNPIQIRIYKNLYEQTIRYLIDRNYTHYFIKIRN